MGLLKPYSACTPRCCSLCRYLGPWLAEGLEELTAARGHSWHSPGHREVPLPLPMLPTLQGPVLKLKGDSR